MSLLIDERPLIVQPSLVKLLGSIERAVALQQIHWLLQQPHTGEIFDDGEKWVWGTLDEWCRDYFQMWSPHTLRKHLNWLRDHGYLMVAKRDAQGWSKTNRYRIDYEKIASSDGGSEAEESASIRRPDAVAMNRPDAIASKRPDVIASKRPDAVAMNRPDAIASKRPDMVASYKEQRLHRDFNRDFVTERDARARESSSESTTGKKAISVADQTQPPVPPPEINLDAWAEFEQHRKEIRKPLTDLARKKAWNQLKPLTHQEQQSVIDYSIAGRYTGLFTDRLTRRKRKPETIDEFRADVAAQADRVRQLIGGLS